MNTVFAEQFAVRSGFVPISMATGANTGDWVSMANYNRITFLFFKAVGTAGQDPTITLLQAKTNAGGSSKALNITRVDKQQGTLLTAVDAWTTSTSASPATNDTFSTNTWTNSDLAEQQAIVLIDIQGEQLDSDGGFYFVNASVADVGTNSQIGGMLYILGEPRYGGPPSQTPGVES